MGEIICKYYQTTRSKPMNTVIVGPRKSFMAVGYAGYMSALSLTLPS